MFVVFLFWFVGMWIRCGIGWVRNVIVWGDPGIS